MLPKIEELDFVDWLQMQLNLRDWRMSNLAAKGKINTGLLAQIMNRQRQPGPTTLIKIADALGIPRMIVFEKYGYWSAPSDEKLKLLEEMQLIARDFSLAELREGTGYLSYVRDRRSRGNNSEHS